MSPYKGCGQALSSANRVCRIFKENDDIVDQDKEADMQSNVIWQNDEKRPCFALWSRQRSNPRLTPSHFRRPLGRKILEAPAHDKEDDNDDQGSRQEIIKVRTSK